MKDADLVACYEEWDPEEMSVSDLCAELGVTKQRLYSALRRSKVNPKTKRPGTDPVVERLDRIERTLDHIERTLDHLDRKLNTITKEVRNR